MGYLPKAVALLAVITQPALAVEWQCQQIGVAVTANDPTFAQEICDMATHARTQLAQCGIEVPMPLEIRVSSDLPDRCLGVFHCGEQLIELAPPDVMQSYLSPENAFAAIPPQDFFASVITHEMVHAAYELAPCPYTSCVATAEYLSYAMQVWTLSDENRARFEDSMQYDHRVSRDEINLIFAFMAPERFLQKAWLHLSQRPDPCGYVGLIMDGAIVFDHPEL